MTYHPISAADAEQEPESDRLFAEPPAPAYPHLTISTTVIDPDGFTWSVTFTDTPLAAAAAVLKKRGCVPAGQPVGASAAPATNGHTPICKYHGPMKESSKAPGTWFCSHKMGDDTYCKERA